MKGPYDAADTQEEKDAISLPLMAWREARETEFLDEEARQGREKKYILQAIKEHTVLVRFSACGCMDGRADRAAP